MPGRWRGLCQTGFVFVLKLGENSVLLSNNTWRSYWVPHEVDMTIAAGKPVYAIRLNGTNGRIPSCLSNNGIKVRARSEPNLQPLATM
jgi:hypothetical protein